MESTAKYYQSIVELPLSKWKECSLKKNYYALVIEGTPTIGQLEAAWLDIVEEFNDRMQDNEGKFYINLLREVGLLEIKMQKVDVCLQALEICLRFPVLPREEKYKTKLNEIVDENFAFHYDKPEEFKKELKRARNRSKSILLSHTIKSGNLKALTDKRGEKIEPTYEYYDSILNELSLFAKYDINDSITVSRFCDYVLKYNKYSKLMESQTKK